MRMILIQGPNGIRRVPERTTFRLEPGEGVIGSEPDETEQELNTELASQGIPLGTFIETAIKLIPQSVRPTHCSRCEQRKLVLNEVRKLGVRETFKRLKEI